MSTNQKNTVSEKKDVVVPVSGSEIAPSNARFLGACGGIGFLPLLEPSPAEETKPAESHKFDQAGSLKDCPEAFHQPQEESLREEIHKEDDIFDANGGLRNCPGAFPVDEPEEESHKEDDIFDANGGLRNCPGAFPVDEPEDSDEAPKAENQVARKELDRNKWKQE